MDSGTFFGLLGDIAFWGFLIWIALELVSMVRRAYTRALSQLEQVVPLTIDDDGRGITIDPNKPMGKATLFAFLSARRAAKSVGKVASEAGEIVKKGVYKIVDSQPVDQKKKSKPYNMRFKD